MPGIIGEGEAGPDTGLASYESNPALYHNKGSASGRVWRTDYLRVGNRGAEPQPKANFPRGFTFYLFDKKQVRISDGYITVSNVGPGEVVKMQLTAGAMGIPASMSISPTDLPPELQPLAPPKTVPVNVTSVPSGAKLKVDGKDAGITPIAIKLAVGSHKLEFSKEGFAPGTYPLTIAPDQLPGGTISFELGGTAFDTIDLRDGTVINGDVESVDATNVVVRVGGNLQNFDRNLVKRILLIEREEPKAAPQPGTQQP